MNTPAMMSGQRYRIVTRACEPDSLIPEERPLDIKSCGKEMFLNGFAADQCDTGRLSAGIKFNGGRLNVVGGG
jgi:hypothetical protein